MPFILTSYKVDDYEQWKTMFDSDPIGRKEAAASHQIFQATDDPNHVFVGLEFRSVEDAEAFRERLLASGVLDGMRMEASPTIVEMTDRSEY